MNTEYRREVLVESLENQLKRMKSEVSIVEGYIEELKSGMDIESVFEKGNPNSNSELSIKEQAVKICKERKVRLVDVKRTLGINLKGSVSIDKWSLILESLKAEQK